MFLVNFVYDDEELLEPYEWNDDDHYEEFYFLPIFRVKKNELHDFLYGQLHFQHEDDSIFIVTDTHYSVVIEIKNAYIYRRGTVTLKQRQLIQHISETLPYTSFDYQVVEEAYDKEFGLTRFERIKKICIEEVIDEIFVVHYDLFLEICKLLHIYKDSPNEQYKTLKEKLDKGYSSLHEILYQELVKKK